jgi:hypothetical protein
MKKYPNLSHPSLNTWHFNQINTTHHTYLGWASKYAAKTRNGQLRNTILCVLLFYFTEKERMKRKWDSELEKWKYWITVSQGLTCSSIAPRDFQDPTTTIGSIKSTFHVHKPLSVATSVLRSIQHRNWHRRRITWKAVQNRLCENAKSVSKT